MFFAEFLHRHSDLKDDITTITSHLSKESFVNSCAPYIYKTRVSLKMHLKMHPKSSLPPKTQKKGQTRKKKITDFRILFQFFSFSVLVATSDVFRGVFRRSEGFCILEGAQEIARKVRQRLKSGVDIGVFHPQAAHQFSRPSPWPDLQQGDLFVKIQ